MSSPMVDRPLTQARLVNSIQSALRMARIAAARYSGHSFRIGAATTAALAGLPDSLIKTLGRWESSAYALYMVYIRTPPPTLYSVSGVLVAYRAFRVLYDVDPYSSIL